MLHISLHHAYPMLITALGIHVVYSISITFFSLQRKIKAPVKIETLPKVQAGRLALKIQQESYTVTTSMK